MIFTPEEENRIIEIVKGQLISVKVKKTGDSPLEAFDLVNKKHLQQNGSVASRPTPPSSDVGRMFFNTDSARANWWTGSVWKDANGNTV